MVLHNWYWYQVPLCKSSLSLIEHMLFKYCIQICQKLHAWSRPETYNKEYVNLVEHKIWMFTFADVEMDKLIFIDVLI